MSDIDYDEYDHPLQKVPSPTPEEIAERAAQIRKGRVDDETEPDVSDDGINGNSA